MKENRPDFAAKAPILDIGGGLGTKIPAHRQAYPDAEVICLDRAACAALRACAG